MARYDLTNQTHLSKIYFDDRKLRDFALMEFFRSARSERITAFIGSMATEGLGYPAWNDLLAMSGEGVVEVAGDQAENPVALAERFNEELWSWLSAEMRANKAFDGRIVGSVIGHWIDNITGLRGAGKRMNHALASRLSFKSKKISKRSERAILEALIGKLGIRRFITTNYDMEVEFTIARIFDDKVKDRYEKLKEAQGEFGPDDHAPAMQRLVRDDGLVMASDAFNRERLDRLIEFSLGSTEVDFHVLHLHGRMDKPSTMVVGYRDYDRLYRRSGTSKAPFEQALTMLHSANPVLFIGLGMKEAELNQALEYLVGNQPFKGIGRRFLLWSPPEERTGDIPVSAQHVRAAFRLEKLHKLGVLTIFGDEIEGVAPLPPIPARAGEKKKRQLHREALAGAISGLAGHVETEHRRRLSLIPDEAWRTVDFRGDKPSDPICFTWHFARKFSRNDIVGDRYRTVSREGVASQRLLVNTSRPGTGKGETATATAVRWAYDFESDVPVPRLDRPVLLANMSLRLDTDSILESVLQFLWRASGQKGVRDRSREHEFRDLGKKLFMAAPGCEPLIIFKGLERLFSKTGVPLSAEMDQFFRSYLIAAIEARRKDVGNLKRICPIIVFGTRRMRIYFNRLQDQVHYELAARLGPMATEQEDRERCRSIIHVDRSDTDPIGYLQTLRSNFHCDVGGYQPRLAGDRSYARRTYAKIFSSPLFEQEFPANTPKERVAYAVMTVMAFVGQPVEAEVLFHAPRVKQAFERAGKVLLDLAARRSLLKQVLDILSQPGFNLVHRIARPEIAGLTYNKTSGYHMERYALHMTLQAEFRERYGVPLSEAVLSTSFNMSLYSAQPADAAVSDPLIHDELGKLIDWFIGAHRDEEVLDDRFDLPTSHAGDSARRRARPHVAAALRAAFAILRGFYSTSALLSLDLGDRTVDEQRDGALTEHASRIERLIRAFSRLATDRAIEAGRIGDAATAREQIGPGALYKDELVWLHNERGVVKLAQGDIHEAQESLNEADRINAKEVEFGCRSHNWRRIWLNLLIVDIEQGKLIEAEDRVGRIENSFDIAGQVEVIRAALRDMQPGISAQLPLRISHEDCLAAALATGYRGLIMFLRGELHSADGLFKLAIIMLENLDEQRACALFRRHRAALLTITEGREAGAAEAKLAIAGAESVQQMDIVYGARIVRTQEHASSSEAEHRRSAMTTLTRAIEFAGETDLYRIAIEARRNLAILKLNNGDLESALEHASIAAALAGRYGMSLFKITIRITLGRILHERGAKDAANALIHNAIVQADRIGYQRAVEAAQFAMAKMR